MANRYSVTKAKLLERLIREEDQRILQTFEFNSKEYFAFAAKESRALPWLALGQNVQFVLDDMLYEIYDTNN